MGIATAFAWSGLAQTAGNSSSWIWAVIILVIVILLLWWLGREETREPMETGKPTTMPEMDNPQAGEGLPVVSAIAPVEEAPVTNEAALAQAGMVTDETPAAVVDETPAVEAVERAPVVDVPPAGENVEVITSDSTPEVVEAAFSEAPVEDTPPVEPVETAAPAAPAEVISAERNDSVIENLVGTENPVEKAVEADVPIQPDDLEIIEGIGPKIAVLLKAQGITTFAQLAATDVGELQRILAAANLRIADPSTWAEQARLAAEGKLAELNQLQENLKGGRRVA